MTQKIIIITHYTPGVGACCCSKKLGLNTALSMIDPGYKKVKTEICGENDFLFV